MKFLKVLFSKASIMLLALILQISIICFFSYVLNMSYAWIQFLTLFLSVITFLVIVNREGKPEYKLPWIVLVLLFPILGITIYALFGNVKISKKHKKLFGKINNESVNLLSLPDTANIENLKEYKGQSLAIRNQSGFPAYENSDVKYFSIGETFYESLLVDLKSAKKFIFMEYFIIEHGEMWENILSILKEKVDSGVDVRVMYDDVGCLWRLKNNYYKKLRNMGIKCVKFNRFNPSVSNVHNYRDHRKITVIDGVVSYTGGINLADPYINKKQIYGHWKDTAIRIEGEATKSFTIMFLQNFILMSGKNYKEDISGFISNKTNIKASGVIQPFGANPLEKTGETAILNIINQAKKYVYITTPYLICDYSMLSALKYAALRGVDVRLVVPNIPDKKIIWHITRSNFESLINAGVKIYQYTPGFIHSKVVLCDDDIALVGTINLDYRSLVHHFEDAVFMYKTDCLKDISNDFANLFEVSTLQTKETAKLNIFGKLVCAVAKIFSPLM